MQQKALLTDLVRKVIRKTTVTWSKAWFDEKIKNMKIWEALCALADLKLIVRHWKHHKCSVWVIFDSLWDSLFSSMKLHCYMPSFMLFCSHCERRRASSNKTEDLLNSFSCVRLARGKKSICNKFRVKEIALRSSTVICSWGLGERWPILSWIHLRKQFHWHFLSLCRCHFSISQFLPSSTKSLTTACNLSVRTFFAH